MVLSSIRCLWQSCSHNLQLPCIHSLDDYFNPIPERCSNYSAVVSVTLLFDVVIRARISGSTFRALGTSNVYSFSLRNSGLYPMFVHTIPSNCLYPPSILVICAFSFSFSPDVLRSLPPFRPHLYLSCYFYFLLCFSSPWCCCVWVLDPVLSQFLLS